MYAAAAETRIPFVKASDLAVGMTVQVLLAYAAIDTKIGYCLG